MADCPIMLPVVSWITVSCALHSTSLEADNNYYPLQCVLPVYYVSSNDDNTLKLTEDEENDQHRLQPLVVSGLNDMRQHS
jgi:hypothetical protein